MTDKPSVEAVLTHYGCEHVPSGPGWRAVKCCWHDDTNASASVNTDDNAYTCHACGVKGDSLALIMHAEQCGFPRAVEIGQSIDSDYQPDSPTARGRRPAGRRKTGRKWAPPGRRGRQPWT